MSCTTKIFLTVLLIFINIYKVDCAKILAVFPTPSISHQVVFRPLILELIKREHEVTVITTDPAFPKAQAPVNLTEIDVHDLSYKIWRESLIKESTANKDIYSQIGIFLKLLSKVFEAQLASEEVKNVIDKKKGHYDLLLLEACVRPALIFTDILKIPTILMGSFGGLQYNYELVGAATHKLLYPSIAHRKLYNLTNLEKIQQLYERWRIDSTCTLQEQEDNKLLKRIFGPNTPTIYELSNNVHMLFLNNHPIWADNQPVPPNVVYVGGIHKKTRNKLPQDLDLLLNKSRNGVIYFSLGTNVKSSVLPRNIVQAMIKVFSELPYDVIWKWDQDSLPGISENIKIYKWLPQSDLLKHPKIKLFITQAGLQSTDEAIDAGVPLVGIPMLFDQWYNTEKYKYHKIGIKLDFTTLTEEIFKEAINTVISDKSYRDNIIKLRSIMEFDPQTALERAVWWTEYVLRHGGAKHLRAAGANISWSQYLELELVAIVVFTLFSALVLLSLFLYTIYRLLLSILRKNNKIKIS